MINGNEVKYDETWIVIEIGDAMEACENMHDG